MFHALQQVGEWGIQCECKTDITSVLTGIKEWGWQYSKRLTEKYKHLTVKPLQKTYVIGLWPVRKPEKGSCGSNESWALKEGRERNKGRVGRRQRVENSAFNGSVVTVLLIVSPAILITASQGSLQVGPISPGVSLPSLPYLEPLMLQR